MRVFSEAIEQALCDGFHGFRAAADMSWALTLGDGTDLLIAYEALLRMLFTRAQTSSLLGTDGLPPSISFSTNYPEPLKRERTSRAR